jgi:hypothetical protein
VYHAAQPDGTSIVGYVSPEAAQKGIAIGDKILNPEEDTLGDVGTPVTLRVQRGNLTVREVTFVRKPSAQAMPGGILFGLSEETSTTLALLFVLVPIILGGIAAVLIFWLRSDDWMALLTGIILTGFTTIPSSNPYIVIFRLILTPLLFAWLILYPNGKLAPRWSWVLIFFLLPKSIFSSLSAMGMLSNSLPPLVNVLSAVGGLGIFGVVLFRYLRLLSPIERQQSKWIIIPLIVGLVPIVILEFLSNLYWNSGQIDKSLMVVFVTSAIGLIVSSLVILGALVSIFRFRST